MRAFFAEGVDNMHWAVEGLPTLLHLSLFLFFGGLAIFLFDVDREVFGYVVWWIGLFCLVYGMITVLPLIRQDSPYNSPFSTAAWFLHAPIAYVTIKILTFFAWIFCLCFILFYFCFRVFCLCFLSLFSLDRFDDPITGTIRWIRISLIDLGEYYRRRMLGGVEKAIEEVVSKRLSAIDVRILDWTITTLGDDDSLKTFFETIPGFFNSKLVQHLEGGLPEELRSKYKDAIKGFLDRTWTSNSINNSEKTRRFVISINAMNSINDSYVPSILCDALYKYWDQVPHTLEMGQNLARWCTSDSAAYTHIIIARILAIVPERDDRWVTLAARVSDLSEQELWENIGLGDDSLLLAILIHVTRRWGSSGTSYYWNVLEVLSKLDIRNTLPGLQHDFCALWNETIQEARKQGIYSTPGHILRIIRHPHIALHQGTDAALTAFAVSSLPLCNLASHRPDSIAQIPVPNSGQVPLPTQPASPPESDNTASRQAEQVKSVTKPPSSPNPATTSDVGATCHGPNITPPTNSVPSSSRPIGASPTTVVVDAPQDVTSTTTLSRPREGSELQGSDIDASSAKPGTISQNLPKSYEACVTSISDSSHNPLPFIGSFIPASRPIGDALLPRLRARGLVNTGNMCFANAVLQLLVNLPPFWNLFKELRDLKGRRGARVPGTGGGAMPLVDTTIRFFEEFMVGEESPAAQQQPQMPTGGTSADEERKDDSIVNSFEPTYVYDAMKEKRQLKPLLVRSRAHVATSY